MSDTPKVKVKVLFVCMGNICRSPAAHGVFRHLVERAGLSGKIEVDSAGTGGWHEGDPPDGRMIRHAKSRGYELKNIEARQIQAPRDLQTYDYILTMDNVNLQNVRQLDVQKQHQHKIKPLVSFCRIHQVEEVPDPYYRQDEGFEHVLDLIEDACTELLNHIKKDLAS